MSSAACCCSVSSGGRDFNGAIAQAREALALNANDAVSREILELATAGVRERGGR